MSDYTIPYHIITFTYCNVGASRLELRRGELPGARVVREGGIATIIHIIIIIIITIMIIIVITSVNHCDWCVNNYCYHYYKLLLLVVVVSSYCE